MEHRFVDPVCGMEVNPQTASERVEYKGEAIFFCSKECREKFEKNPAQYMKVREQPPRHEKEKTER